MITLIVSDGETGKELQRYDNLMLKELGAKLVELGKEYFLMFETARDIEPAVSCTLYIAATKRDR